MNAAKNPSCPYCGLVSVLVTGKVVYPHLPKLKDKCFYKCPNDDCDAFVGCHPNTTNPMGRLANAELRRNKLLAHNCFDKLWKSGSMSRSSAYKMLANKLGIEAKDCHIGMFDVHMCKRVMVICIPLTKGM